VGAAVHLPERDLTAHSLASHITDLVADRARLESLAANARARGNPNAARDVMSKILTLLE
jgi:UDP-N-acetylglucosamine:LPS N-acetylglucosamine transferase